MPVPSSPMRSSPAASSTVDEAAASLLSLARRLDDYPRLADALRGKWLGHPLHPALTDLPIGFWTSAWVLDLLPGGRDAARRLIGLGVLAAAPTALAGAADWPRQARQEDPTVLAHVTCNLSATALYALSWRARRQHHWFKGFLLAQLAAGAATGGAALGGILAFRDPEPDDTATEESIDIDLIAIVEQQTSIEQEDPIVTEGPK